MGAEIGTLIGGLLTQIGGAALNFIVLAFNTLIWVPADGSTPAHMATPFIVAITFLILGLILAVLSRGLRKTRVV